VRASGGLIAGISLIVGGIGITNIMLASITERIREIGVRRAVGAKGRDIFIQIVVESAVVGFIGGLLGLVASFGVMRIPRGDLPRRKCAGPRMAERRHQLQLRRRNRNPQRPLPGVESLAYRADRGAAVWVAFSISKPYSCIHETSPLRRTPLIALLLTSGISCQADQFVLFDVTFTYTKADADNAKPSPSHYYVKSDRLKPDRPEGLDCSGRLSKRDRASSARSHRETAR
jgi:hypothetical protein